MKTLFFNTIINAPRQKVWETMLNPDTYKQWTAEFNPGSYYEGSWNEGSKIRFVGPDKDGRLMGIASVVKQSRPNEFVYLEHQKEIADGVERDSEWAGATESYSFKDVDGGTELIVQVQVLESEAEVMNELWLKDLKQLVEVQN